jgi:hypothetical protein
MSKQHIHLGIEVEKMTIIVAQRMPLDSLLTRTVKSKFTGEMVTYIKKTPYILEDNDTSQHVKYWLHSHVKRHCFEAVTYEEIVPFDLI